MVLKKLSRIVDEILPRSEFLEMHGYHIESFYLLAAILEIEIERLLSLYEQNVSFFVEKGESESDFSFDVESFKKRYLRNKMTIGQSIEYMSFFCKDDKILKELQYFNDLRRKCVHGLFDEKNNLSELDILVSGDQERFFKLLEDIDKLQGELIDSLMEKCECMRGREEKECLSKLYDFDFLRDNKE